MMVINKFNKYLLSFLFIFLFVISFSSCKKDNEEINDNTKSITIYTVNDFHGAIKDKAAKVGSFFTTNSDETIRISAGDMFQGSALSNYSYGRSMVDIMNLMSFDSMTIGNHEFDWSLDTVLNYFDGNQQNCEANFPLLGSNIIDKRTNDIPSYMKAYQIVERNSLKVGIIGYVGLGLGSDISSEMVENYEFIDPIDCIKKYTKQLRTIENVDIVIVVGHDGSTMNNRLIANLEGDERVDAIINGHTHVHVFGNIVRSFDQYKVPYIQAGSSGEYVGEIKLTYDLDQKKVVDNNTLLHKIDENTKEDVNIKNYVNKLVSDTAPVFEEILGYAGSDMNNSQGIKWASNSLLKYCQGNFEQCDVAFINIGGIREAAFPIKEGEAITYERIYQMMPFDNGINLVTIKGNVLNNLILNKGELAYSENSVTVKGSAVYINGELIDENANYCVAVVDYIFNKDTYPFKKGTDVVKLSLNFREILMEIVRNDNLEGKRSFI